MILTEYLNRTNIKLFIYIEPCSMILNGNTFLSVEEVKVPSQTASGLSIRIALTVLFK